MKSFFCELLFGCIVASPGAAPVEDLTYGTVLYAYYQDDYAGALVNTLVAEQQQRVGEDPIRFQLAKGSFAFNDRMFAMADRVFSEVEQSELEDIDRLRLAFHLSRELYRRQDWQRLKAELERIDLGNTWLGKDKRHPEVEFMRAELATVAGEFDQAAVLLDHLDDDDPLRAYGLYNLGVALHGSGAYDRAEVVFTELADTKQRSGEIFDLRQRSKLAVAMLQKQQGRGTEAEAVLDALPAEGRYRDVALATYGGLAMDGENYELAARIWLTLQNQDHWNPSTATARLGFPVSLEQLASMDMALTQYRIAEAGFEQRLAKLQGLTQDAHDPAWVRGLLTVFASPERDGRAVDAVVGQWREQLGHTDWLEWLSTESVHEVLGDWRKLVDERKWLGTLEDRLDTFEELGVEQRRRAAEARHVLNDDGLLRRRSELLATVNTLSATVEAASAVTPQPEMDWMMALATPDERKLLEKLDGMRAGLNPGIEPPQQKRLTQRLDRLRGLVFWEIANSRADRFRQLRKSLREANVLLAGIEDQVGRVQQAENRYVAGVETDYLAFTDRVAQLTAQMDTAIAAREQMLADEIRRGMERESDRVERYLLVTRIAIARATDQLALVSDASP